MVGSWTLGSVLLFIMGYLFKPVERSGDHTAFAAASPVVRERAQDYKGAYLTPIGKISQPSAEARSEQNAIDLWATSEKQLAELGL